MKKSFKDDKKQRWPREDERQEGVGRDLDLLNRLVDLGSAAKKVLTRVAGSWDSCKTELRTK